MAFSHLYYAFDRDVNSFRKIFENWNDKRISNEIRVIESKRTFATSSMGRLFDAVAFIAGVSSVNSYEAEAPMLIESLYDENIEDKYKIEITYKSPAIIEIRHLIRQLYNDRISGIDKRVIASKFINSIASACITLIAKMSEEYKVGDVLLSGGVFQNMVLLDKIVTGINCLGLNAYYNCQSPPNDQSISLGQALYGHLFLKNNRTM
jgi:hydrogenase maturation protein HypF